MYCVCKKILRKFHKANLNFVHVGRYLCSGYIVLGVISNLEIIKVYGSGWSQDGWVGGRGVCVSSQLGHLPDTGGDLDTQGDGRNPWVTGGWAWAPMVCAPNPNHWTNKEPQTLGNINQSEVSRRSSSQHQDPALPSSLQTPVLETSGQTISKTGTPSHPLKKKKRRQKNMLQMKD